MKDQAVLKKELEDLETSAKVASEVFSSYDCRAKFSHQYGSEVCPTEWFDLKCQMKWEPKD